MQTAGGITDDHVAAACLGSGDGVKNDGAGVGTLGVTNDVGVCPLRPDGQLVGCSGAEGIGGSEQHLFALGSQLCADLADGGGLAHTVDTHHQNDRGLGVQLQTVVGCHLVGQNLGQAVDDGLLSL